VGLALSEADILADKANRGGHQGQQKSTASTFFGTMKKVSFKLIATTFLFKLVFYVAAYNIKYTESIVRGGFCRARFF
jgi:hypothetical protein